MVSTEKRPPNIISLSILFSCLLCGFGATSSVDLTEEQNQPLSPPTLSLRQQLTLCLELIGQPQPLDSVKIRPAKYFHSQEHVYLPQSRVNTVR